MKVVIFILRFLEAGILVILFNCATILCYSYLEVWEMELLDYKDNLEEKKEIDEVDRKVLKILDSLCPIYIKFVSMYEWLFRRLDPLNLFALWDEEE